MIYVFDSCALINLFENYYPELFPTLWDKFDCMVDDERIVSVREVKNEIITAGRDTDLVKWAKENLELFPIPVQSELVSVSNIFKIQHFQAIIRKREQLEGKPVADPFVIAKAKVNDYCVVTQERKKKNAAKIPNICEHFNVDCVDLKGFMQRENWVF